MDFKLIDKSYLEDYSADALLYKHKSGMEIYHILSNDKELYFAYSFVTLPEDSSGVFHVIEHTVLSGSEKYPVKDPFTALSSSSCNTYMNALTYPTRTAYPAASPVKKDFDNIFSVYTDAVFRPLMRKVSFLGEGVRLTKKDKGFTYDGVVFNEMRGDESQSESVVARECTARLFDDGPCSKNSGGKPLDIATLSYEKYLETFRKFYSPSNCRLFLYGKDIDIDEVFALLDGYLSSFEYSDFSPRLEETVRWKAPRHLTLPSAASEGESEGTLMLSFLTNCHNDDRGDITFLNLLVDILLGSPSCPLHKAILTSGIGKDISSQCGISPDYYEIPFAVGMTGVEEENTEKAERFILESLEKIVREGINKEIIESSMRRYEFTLKEIPGGIPNGSILFSKCIKGWERGKNPSSMLHPKRELENLRARLEENPRLFEDWIEKNLLSNPHRLTLYVKPESDYLVNETNALERLANENAGKYDEKEDRAAKAFIKEADSEEAKKSIPLLQLEDIPVKCEIIEQEIEDQIILQKQLTGSIVYIDIAINLEDLSVDDLRYMSILTRAISLVGVKGDSDKDNIHRKLRLQTGGNWTYLETGKSTSGKVRAMMVFRMKCLQERVKEALDSVYSLFCMANIDDEEAIKLSIDDILGDYSENVEYSGSSFAAYASSAPLTPSLSLGESVMGLTAWKFFDNLDVVTAKENMIRLYALLKERARYTIHITCEENQANDELANANYFLSRLEESKPVEAVERTMIKEKGECLYDLSSFVAYNSISVPSSSWGERGMEAEELLGTILSSGSLYQSVRGEGGAYGVMARVDTMEGFFGFTSYRDPSIKHTYDSFKKCLEEFTLTDEELENAKLQVLGSYLRPLAPAQKSMLGFRRYIYEIEDEERSKRLSRFVDMKKEDVIEAAKRILSQLDSGFKVTLGPEKLMRDENLDFEVRKLPVRRASSSELGYDGFDEEDDEE
ncbi:MAG: insulinase family protein [Sphaerochaetaceae bacterium]|nr:insulinase family protein [Sphaerochaetaceae bacterium]